MTAAAAAFVLLEQEGTEMPRHTDDEGARVTNDEPFADWSAKELALRAVNATVALEAEIIRLSRAIESLDRKLASDYEDTKTREMNQLRAIAKKAHDRDVWFKRIVTGVVLAVVTAEVLRWLGLPAAAGHG